MHVISQISESIKSLLIGMRLVKSSNIFLDRIHVLEQDELPCVLIMPGNDSAQAATYGSGLSYDRRVDIGIHVCIATSPEAINMEAMEIQLEIEQILGSNTTLNRLVRSLSYSGRTKTLNTDGDTPFIEIVLQYSANYMTEAAHPELSI